MSLTKVESFLHRGFLVEIVYDPDPINPREMFDGASKLWCWHGRMNLGDYKDLGRTERLRTEAEVQAEVRRRGEKPLVIKKLFLFDHSGITISTKPFYCPFDSGQVGWAVVTSESATRCGIKRGRINWAEEVIECEVKSYDRYITGEIYGALIYSIDDNGGKDEQLESMWGIEDIDAARSESKSTIDQSLRSSS